MQGLKLGAMVAALLAATALTSPVWAETTVLNHVTVIDGTGAPPRDDMRIVVRGDRIEWFGAEADLPSGFADASNHDLQQRIVTPGLVDCHTHLVYAGNRAEEFAMRLEGASYEDIAKRGGGIVSTVRNTRAASEDELFAQSLRRLDALLAEGVTALEIKSGYGLDLATERKMPLPRYLMLHHEAGLSQTDIDQLCAWSQHEATRLVQGGS